jgi:hypothetical protein
MQPEARQHSLQPERLTHSFRDLRGRTVVSIEWQRKVFEELGAVTLDALTQSFESVDRQSGGVRFRLQHQRRNRPDEHRLGHMAGAVSPDVTGDFAAARRVANMNRILETEFCCELGQIIGVRVHIIAVPRLARTPMPAAVMGYAAVSARGEKEHLVFKRISVERPAVTEDHRLPAAPVLVLDLGAIFGAEHTHGIISLREG